MKPPSFKECIYWMKFFIWRHLLHSSIFSLVVSSFHWSNWSNPYVKDTVFIYLYCVYIFIYLYILYYNKQSMADSRKVEWYVYLRKAIITLSFKGVKLFYRTSCSNICLKSTVLNARKYFYPPNSMLENVLICNFTTVIAAIY